MISLVAELRGSNQSAGSALLRSDPVHLNVFCRIVVEPSSNRRLPSGAINLELDRVDIDTIGQPWSRGVDRSNRERNKASQPGKIKKEKHLPRSDRGSNMQMARPI